MDESRPRLFLTKDHIDVGLYPQLQEKDRVLSGRNWKEVLWQKSGKKQFRWVAGRKKREIGWGELCHLTLKRRKFRLRKKFTRDDGAEISSLYMTSRMEESRFL